LVATATAEIHPILYASAIAAELLTHVTVVVSDTLPMLRPVLPVVAVQRINAWPVDVDIAVAPITAAAPVISARAPVSQSPTRAEREPGRNESGADISGIPPIIWRVLRIRPRAINDAGIVVWHVERFGVRWLNRDDLPTLLLPFGNRLLLVRAQLVVRIGFRPQALNGVHDIRLLREDRIAQLLRPTELVTHHSQNIRRGR
jgi:hypothetical protein